MFRRAALAAALATTFVFPAAAFGHNGGADAVTVEGTLQFTHSDNFRTKQARYYYTLRQGHKQITLQFKHRRQDLANGMRLSVRGLLYKGRLSVDHVQRLSRAPRTYATVSPGPRKVAVLLFNFTNDTSQPWTPAQAASTMFTAPNSVNNYFQEESYGNVSLTGDVYGWYTLPMTNAGCSVANWASAANTAAANAGVNLSNYQHVVYAFPFADSCYWSGLAEMPGSRVWINGYFQLQTLGHELSHNLGVHHASSLTCLNGGSRVAYGTSCSYSEYGDPFDIMGSGPYQTSVYHKGQIGWLSPLSQQTVTSSGAYTISPTEWAAGGVQSVRIPRGTSGQYFYLEYRRPYGFDTFSLADPVVNGVTIRLAPDLPVINLSYLIDTNPMTATFNDAPLRAGQTFTDSVDGITISTTTVNAGGATVQVTLPGSTPPPPPPPPPPADTTAPSAPGTLTGSAVAGPAVALTWGAATDNTGVAGYRVYRGTTQIGTATGTTYTDSSVSAGTTQSYTVRAYDAAGNLGPTGNTASVTIPSSSTTPPPPPPPPTSGDAPAVQLAPVIKGALSSGATVSASTGTWSGATPMTYTYTWQRCGLLGSCAVISGATSASYTLTSWDIGRKLKVTVTATNAKGTASATSALTALVSRGSTSTPARARDAWDTGWAEQALAIVHAPLARR